MAAKATNPETFRSDLHQLVNAMNDETVATLNGAREAQLAARALLEAEASRLAGKLGADAPRVLALRSAATSRVAVAQAIDVEVQIASVRVPRVEQADTLLHGRVTDQSLGRVAGVTVQLVNARGAPVESVSAVQTDAQGYYAFVLKPEQAQALAKEKLAVTVASGDVAVKPAQPALAVQPGATLVHEIRLTDDELARLKLRPTGGPDLGLRRGGAKAARKQAKPAGKTPGAIRKTARRKTK